MNILQLLGLTGQGPAGVKPVWNQAAPGAELPPVGAGPDPETQIIVDGGARDPGMGNPEPPLMGNRQYLEETARVAENAPQRQGMFGTRGTLRDVLGLVGDAFLVQSGNDPSYQNRRQQEREADAMGGFTNQDPAAMMAAIERLGQVNPEAARELYDSYQDNQYKESARQSLDANRTSMVTDRENDQKERGFNRLSRLAGANAPYEVLVTAAAQYGISSEELARFGIVPGMTPEARELFARGDMTVNQQQQLPFTERRVAATELSAEASDRNSRRPRAAAQPRSQTVVEYVQELINRSNSGESLSVAEQDYLDRQTQPTGSRRRSGIAPPPAAAGPPSRFRRIN